MRIWLIGADEKAIQALHQLHKNPAIEIIVSAETPSPLAVEKGVIEKVDRVEAVTSLNVHELERQVHPDLILIDPTAGHRNYGRVEGGMALADALIYEIAASSNYPCLVL